MAKKKTTLPKNFDELIDTNDIEILKKVFDSCELDARGGYGKHTALSFYNVSDELARWLVEKGANINATDVYQRTALHKHTGAADDITIFLELGANVHAVDNNGDTPLHFAAGSSFNSTAVTKLIQKGANINALNHDKQTPLQYAIKRVSNITIVGLAEISKILLQSDTAITPDMKATIRLKGEDFEFHRENFNKEYLAETDQALTTLYELFAVEPVKKRIMHDGISQIMASETTWEKQFEELWELLIPSSGNAKTIQGEVVRIAGRIRDEIYRNGGTNWNSDYKKMLDAFYSHIYSGNSLSIEDLEKVDPIIKEIRKTGDAEDKELNYLCKKATQWVLLNPKPILLDKPNYKR